MKDGEFDEIERPAHYARFNIEPIDAIEDWQLGFCDGAAVKYIARARHKGERIKDLKKARWMLAREIARLEKEQAPALTLVPGNVYVRRTCGKTMCNHPLCADCFPPKEPA